MVLLMFFAKRIPVMVQQPMRTMLIAYGAEVTMCLFHSGSFSTYITVTISVHQPRRADVGDDFRLLCNAAVTTVQKQSSRLHYSTD